ncbi:MAG: PDZ domain-containing protein [Oligoflexales bacterium]
MVFLRILIVALGFAAGIPALADVKDFRVLGVIADPATKEGVVLFKNTQSNKVFAVTAPQEIEPGLTVISVTKKLVVLKSADRSYQVTVGQGSGQITESSPGSSNTSPSHYASGMERNGDTLLVQEALKQDLIENRLSSILMEAAATPYMTNGRLTGFVLTDIVPGSLFEAVGFVNGDVVTHINGQPLTDAASAVRLLNRLKDQNEADITFLRQNASQDIKIVIK